MIETDLQPEITDVRLIDEDQAWLATFGVEADWLTDETLRDELDELVRVGSMRVNAKDSGVSQDDIVQARFKFLEYAGIDESVIERVLPNNPNLVPLSTIIRAQRTYHEYGLDAQHLLNKQPRILVYSEQAIRGTVSLLKELGLHPVHTIERSPGVIGAASESLRGTIELLQEAGFDAQKVISLYPTVLSVSQESLSLKINYLYGHGIDAQTVFEKYPSGFGLSIKNIEAKIICIQRSIRVLGWEGSAAEFIEANPNILGFSLKKIVMMRRIAAEYISSEDREVDAKTLGGALRRTLEGYILAAEEIVGEEATVASLDWASRSLRTNAQNEGLDPKKEAIRVAETGKLGRLGTQYLRYI